MLIPSSSMCSKRFGASLSRRVNANSQLLFGCDGDDHKLIKKGEC